jgi:hypothetical protein
MDTDILILKDLNEVLVTWRHKWIDNYNIAQLYLLLVNICILY